MAKRALSWKRAAAIAWRDLKSAPGKFGFVVLSVAVGVAAMVGVRGLSGSFRSTLNTQARSLLAGDLSVRMFRAPTQEELKKIIEIEKQSGGAIRSTWTTETVSMASVPSAPVPLLVSLKAVDPAEYPYYGTAELEPAMPLQQALQGNSAIVADEFLIRLNSHVGETLRLGDKNFRITAVLKQEPDRISSGMGIGPRVMISQASLADTGLLGPGSRASRRLLVKLPDTPPRGLTADAETAAVRTQLEAALPDAQVIDFREGNPALTRGLDNATSILSLICLVAMVLGAIGVAMAMHAHLEQRMDMLAILKAVGAGSADLLRIFLLQTLGLGLAGGLLGVAAGVGVMAALPAAFGQLLPVHVILQFPWQSVLAGLATGLLTTLLFCLPPLLDVREVRPVLVFAGWWNRTQRASANSLRDGGSGACNSESQRLLSSRSAVSPGCFQTRLKWVRGSPSFSPSPSWCCWQWQPAHFASCDFCWIACACACPRRFATVSPISTGPETSRLPCSPRLVRASCSFSPFISCRRICYATCMRLQRRACRMSSLSTSAPVRSTASKHSSHIRPA